MGYEKIDVDSKTRKQLSATISNRQVKQAIRLLTPNENDLVFKREILMHKDCISNLYPFLFKYLVPGLRKKAKENIDGNRKIILIEKKKKKKIGGKKKNTLNKKKKKKKKKK